MRRILTSVLLLLLLPGGLRAQAVLYVASGGGNLSSLYTVDAQTAATTLIGQIRLNGTTQLTITALAFQPGTGVLFGVSGNEYSPSRQLVTIDTTNGNATSLGTIGSTSSQNASDIAFATNGTLYGWTTRGGPLVSLDITNATRSVIGSALNGTQGNGLSFTPNGTLYLAGPTPGDLYSVNVGTGAITSVATLSNLPLNFGTSINAMASDPSGKLYVTGRGSGHQLVTIDTATGVMTSVGTLPFEADALAFYSIPEPATGLLLAGGAVLLWVARRRRAVS